MVVTIHLVEVDGQFFEVLCANSCVFVLKSSINNSLAELALRIDVSDLRSEGTQKQKKQPEIKLTILSSDVSANKKLLALATTAKRLALFDLPSLLKSGNGIVSYDEAKWQTIQKTPTAIHFSASGEALLVSTRSGSVMEYRITDSDFSSGGIELVSHFSMVLDHCLSPGKPKFLLSADRDEKVRVSHYPNTQIIECFCLGHSSFVNSVCCLDDQIAISGGGDGILRVWKFKIGKCLCESSKLGDSPIRKVRALHENGIVALSEGALEIFHFVFNPQGPSVELSRTFFADDQLFDFAVDEQCQRIFAVGRKGLFHCAFGVEAAVVRVRMESMPLGGDALLLLTELADRTDLFPLGELFKTVGFGNLEMYQRRKEGREEERKKRRKTGTNALSDSHCS
ncbi:hypothetical protein GPALN_006483 [Globodera pallida]|nr:hypothetical protein GPALN_006483 [Globodera pallida]